MRLAIATLAALLMAAPADAAVVEMTRVEHVSDEGTHYDRTVSFRAAPGERNDVSISIDLNDTMYTGAITISDPGAELAVEGGCTLAGPHVAVCGSQSDPFGRLNVRLGDRNDMLRVTSSVRYGPIPVLKGGPGSDTIDGSMQSDKIDGGPGDDVIDGGIAPDTAGDHDDVTGGGGRDRMNGRGGDFLRDGDDEDDPDADVFIGDGTTGITYAARRRPVAIDLDAGHAGRPGEGDRVSGIAYAHGGRGDDVVLGSHTNDFLNGNGGDDLVDGRRGDDILDGGAGADQARGDGGRDTFWSAEDDSVDVISCGTNFDRLEGQDARDLVRTDCERAGWSMSGRGGDESITVEPAFGPDTLDFHGFCPSGRCGGTIELRTRRSRKLLARGRFEIVGTEEGPIRATVTELGRELLLEGRGRYVRVVIRSNPELSCDGCIDPPTVTSGFTTIMRRPR